MQDKFVGVDIGGTNITAGLIVDGEVVKINDVATEAFESKEKILENLFEAIESVLTDGTEGIGIGVPGIVDSEKGIIYDLANIPSWKEVHIKELVEARFDIVTEVGNDANCFALGVKHFGVGRNYSNIVGLTLGTGLGAGVIINNALYTGSEGGAGEFGLVPYLDSNIETYCSGKFFKCVKEVPGKEVYEKAHNGDTEALKIWEEYGKHLGQLVNIVTYTLSPELVVFGGSVAKGYPFFIDSLKAELKSNILKKVVAKLELAEMANEFSAIYGAGALCKAVAV